MYVFGIDFPIMELLFLFGMFSLVGLVVIWIEIRKLRSVISKEEKGVSRFEKDIKKLEIKCKKKKI